MRRRGAVVVGAVLGLLVAVGPAAAVNHLVAIEEVLGSWQGDDTVQMIELRMLAPGQGQLSDGGGVRGTVDLIIDDPEGSADGRRVFTFTRDMPNQQQGARVLIATPRLQEITGLLADFTLPAGVLRPKNGRVCYAVNAPQPGGQASGLVDCVAYGRFTGDNGTFGRPTPVTPDNRSLRRAAFTGVNRDDWVGVLEPTPERNDGQGVRLPTLCGDEAISQGEECDGDALGGATCASLDFARGTLGCDQCHYDTSRCTACGNDAINEREECDGTDLGERTCATLGFTGGTLGCTERCRLTTAECDPTFFVPGGGPRGPECLAAWRVTNAGRRPGADGRAPQRQPCRDGDAGCDADAVAGQCTFMVAVCFDREDARLARADAPCRTAPLESWTLLAPAVEVADTTGLVAAVAAVAPSSVALGAVRFVPPLDASERCTEAIGIVVPSRGGRPGKLALRARAVAFGGKPKDTDGLKLVCTP